MDTAEYETNALVVNDISSVAYAFYEPISPSHDSFGPCALELEGVLRKDGFLPYIDSARRGLWSFNLHQKDSQQEQQRFPRSITRSGYSLSLSDEGTFEPAALVKSRGVGLHAVNTPSSSSSSASNPLDLAFRAAQSLPLPSPVTDHESKALAVSDAKSPSTTTVKDAHEHFISAILAAISSAFYTRTGATPLNSRTFVLPQCVQGDTGIPVPVLASLRVYLTTTGSLVVSLGLSQVEGLVALSDSTFLPPLGVTVLAAPLGVFGTCQGITDSEQTSAHSALAQSPETSISRIRPEREMGTWRSICNKLLHARNLPYPISGTEKWLSLQRVRRKPIEPRYDGKRTPMVHTLPSVAWPSNLCFCKAFSVLDIKDSNMEAPTDIDLSYDPLASAQSWFLGAGEREESLLQKKRERDATATQEVNSAAGQPQQGTGLSPVALHRPGHVGVPPGAMYPTPPDGVQNMVGVTPSMDGTMSSPGNNTSTTAMVDIDTVMNVPPDGFHEGWDHVEPKRERNGNSFETENLFGDLGPDMFGDNDITDADFSFFDEQPGSMDLGLDMTHIHNADGLLDMAAAIQQPADSPIKAEALEPLRPSAPPAPVFAKPELKHARSSLNEQARRRTESSLDRPQSLVAKRQGSPFNPDTVFKRIRASLDNRAAVQQNANINVATPGSIFDKVDFGPGLSMVNRKYQGGGRFEFSPGKSEESEPFIFDAPPTTGYLQRHGRGRRGLKNPPANVGELFARMTSGQSIASQHPSPAKIEDPASDADEASLVSDQDDSSYESDEPASPFKAGSLRKRRMDDDEQSLATSFRDLDYLDPSSPNGSVDLPKFSKSDTDLLLTRYFAEPEPSGSEIQFQDRDLIMAAQILTEQACTGTLELMGGLSLCLQSRLDRRRQLLSLTHQSMQELRSVLPKSLGEVTPCQFKPFIEVQDVPLVGQPTRMQPRPPNAEQLKPSNPFQIPSPRFEVRRSDSKLSVLPSAVTFWESLGLGPSNGGKDIVTISIYPDLEGITDDVNSFVDKMQSVYESLKLGSLNRMSTSPEFPGGLLSYQADRASESFHDTASLLSTSLMNKLSKLSDALAQVPEKETNFVVFFVYAADSPRPIVEACYAFNQLFERFNKVLTSQRKTADNDIVLQLVPMNFVTSTNSVSLPSPLDYVRLTLEVYDRCTLFNGVMPAPAVVLEQTLPRMIDFKLTTIPSASLLHENTCLHVAYAQSIDERWITAAWTDNRGNRQMTASYCLGRKRQSISRHLSDIGAEIWDTTRDLMSTSRIHWRVIITKCGIMEQPEIDMWASLAVSESGVNVTLTIMTVDTDPSLQLIPPEVKVPSQAPTVFYNTPVSTPQPSMVSPEQSGYPSTPSFRDNTSAPTPGGNDNAQDSEADATLTDVTDQVWGAILSHRLNNSISLTELNPAIVSGYLVKRGGAKVEDPPAVMEVNIVYSEGNPRAYETLLREILTYFRGLGTLARARGMVDREVDVRPWHIAAAERGVRALYMLM